MKIHIKTVILKIHKLFFIPGLLFCKLFGFSLNEYKYYHFSAKGLFKRLSFVSNKQCSKEIKKLNKVFTSKKDNYCLLKDYYKRDVCILNANGINREQLLRDFVKNHKQFFVKSFEGSGSQGIQKISADCSDEWIYSFLDNHPESCMLEELIEQTEDFAKIHPQSINTLRITTVNCNGVVKAIHPVMRFGVGDNYCDNKSGLLCSVNPNTKKVVSAFNTSGESFEYHPDTGEPIVGFNVPEFESAVEMAKKMALVFPNNVFTGWDFAHTKDGWILVEANTNTSFTIWQLPEQKGFRKELSKIK